MIRISNFLPTWKILLMCILVQISYILVPTTLAKKVPLEKNFGLYNILHWLLSPWTNKYRLYNISLVVLQKAKKSSALYKKHNENELTWLHLCQTLSKWSLNFFSVLPTKLQGSQFILQCTKEFLLRKFYLGIKGFSDYCLTRNSNHRTFSHVFSLKLESFICGNGKESAFIAKLDRSYKGSRPP